MRKHRSSPTSVILDLVLPPFFTQSSCSLPFHIKSSPHIAYLSHVKLLFHTQRITEIIPHPSIPREANLPLKRPFSFPFCFVQIFLSSSLYCLPWKSSFQEHLKTHLLPGHCVPSGDTLRPAIVTQSQALPLDCCIFSFSSQLLFDQFFYILPIYFYSCF